MNRQSEVAIKVERAKRLLQSELDNFHYGNADEKFSIEEILRAKAFLTEAELLLKTDTGATHGNPPLRKH